VATGQPTVPPDLLALLAAIAGRCVVPAGPQTGALVRAVALPDVSRARLVAGVAGPDAPDAPPRRGLAAAIAAYGALRDPRVRAGRLAVAGLVLAGQAGETVAVAPSSTDAPTGRCLGGDLAALLGRPAVLWLAGVRADQVTTKPTLQVFDLDGHPLAYAKVGRNAVTDDLVRTEVAALTRIGTDLGGGALRLPTLLHGGPLGDRTVCVTAPLPVGVRRPPTRCLPGALALGALEAVDARREPWAASPLAQRMAAAPATGTGTRHLRDLLSAFDRRSVRTGWWHGDWVPWNLAVEGPTLWAFDWEYAEPGAPAGLDLVHHTFQRARVERRRPLARALDAAADIAGGLTRTRDDRRLLTIVHRLALALRAEAARARGLDPDPDHAAIADAIAHGERDAA
jgi:hypothetical protein